jgi:TPR repeat protein
MRIIATVLIVILLPLQANDRYNESEIKEDISSAWSWIKEKSKQGYEITKNNIQKDSKALKKAYKEFMHDESGEPLSDQELINKLNVLAEKGSAKAQYYLGLSYLYAKDVYKDRDKAIMWLKRSVANGCKEASEFLKNNNLEESNQ